MRTLKILFADDQILPNDISEDQSTDWIESNFPKVKWSDSFIEAFTETKKTVKRLQRDGYDIILARTIPEAEMYIREQIFDIAILDLGWGTDSSIPENERAYIGWKLADLIAEIDHQRQTTTMRIMYSIKFLKDPELSRIAANKGILSIFKSEASGPEGRESLMAAVNFIKSLICTLTPERSISVNAMISNQKLMTDMLSESLRQYRGWFIVTIFFVSVSIITLIATGFIVLFNEGHQINTITALSNILTNIISALLLRELQKAREDVKKCREEIRNEITKSL